VAMNPERFQIILIAPASLVASSAVAVAVIIGLVGWSFHMLRMIFCWIRTLNPLSLPFGASFLAVVDDFAYPGHLF